MNFYSIVAVISASIFFWLALADILAGLRIRYRPLLSFGIGYSFLAFALLLVHMTRVKRLLRG